MVPKYHGCIAPIVTPVDEHENVDEKGFRALLDWCVAGGLHGILVAGTNGETMALTQKERLRAIRIAVDQIGGRIPVMAGCMDTSTRRVIENIRAAQDVGAACAAVTPVFYDRHTSQDETVRHFERILQETDIPELVIYNIPPFVGIKLTPQTIIRISELDSRIVGCKDSSGDYSGFMTLLHHFKGTSFSLMNGATPQALSEILLGAAGFLPSVAPVFPELFADAYDAAVSGNVELTWEYDALLAETSKILGMSKNATAAAKYAISLRGMTDKRVMWPQDATTPEDEARIAAQVKKIDEMYRQFKEEHRA